MRVTIHGPNLRDQSKGQFHVHASGCRDNAKYDLDQPPIQLDVSSRAEVVETIYGDHEGFDPADDAYRSDFHFAPCLADLGEATPTRRERLVTFCEHYRGEGCEPYLAHDEQVNDLLAGQGEVPRFAMTTSEGSGESSYFSNQNVTVHETLADVEAQAASEMADGWCCNEIMDLDTACSLDWRISINVETPEETARRYARAAR